MRVLVVGAGAVGGYFGGRLAEKGANVTFFVRGNRQTQLVQNGLIIHSVNGDAQFPVKTIVNGDKVKPFELIILTTKAYHLAELLPTLTPYMSSQTTILPLLNGIAHFTTLQEMYGQERVIGGLCYIESTLNAKGEVEHYSPYARIVFGEFDGTTSDRIQAIKHLFAGSKLAADSSTEIRNEIWKKYIIISTMAGMTCLTRSSMGPILESISGKETYGRLLQEIYDIALHQEPTLDKDIWKETMARAVQVAPTLKSSMLRDLEKGLPIETEHFHGTLLQLAPPELDTPILKAVYSTLSIYQKSISG
jgi:2-dehydropantoate 2-reductase